MKTMLTVLFATLFVSARVITAHTPSQQNEKSVLGLTGEYVLSVQTFVSTKNGHDVMSVVLDSKEKGSAQSIVFDQDVGSEECVNYKKEIGKVEKFLVTFEYVTDVTDTPKFGLPKTLIKITILGLAKKEEGKATSSVIYEKRVFYPFDDRSFIFNLPDLPKKKNESKEKKGIPKKEVGPDDGRSALV